jgi:G:T-mismatch repair DNA endonuclease (very short patch repair protein)
LFRTRGIVLSGGWARRIARQRDFLGAKGQFLFLKMHYLFFVHRNSMNNVVTLGLLRFTRHSACQVRRWPKARRLMYHQNLNRNCEQSQDFIPRFVQNLQAAFPVFACNLRSICANAQVSAGLSPPVHGLNICEKSHIVVHIVTLSSYTLLIQL